MASATSAIRIRTIRPTTCACSTAFRSTTSTRRAAPRRAQGWGHVGGDYYQTQSIDTSRAQLGVTRTDQATLDVLLVAETTFTPSFAGGTMFSASGQVIDCGIAASSATAYALQLRFGGVMVDQAPLQLVAISTEKTMGMRFHLHQNADHSVTCTGDNLNGATATTTSAGTGVTVGDGETISYGLIASKVHVEFSSISLYDVTDN